MRMMHIIETRAPKLLAPCRRPKQTEALRAAGERSRARDSARRAAGPAAARNRQAHR